MRWRSRDAFSIATLDAAAIAIRFHLLKEGAPMVNTPMLGVLSKASGLVSLEHLEKGLKWKLSGAAAATNIAALRAAYEETSIKENGIERPVMEIKDDNISAMCKPAIGEAGKTGDWRDATPVIDHAKCIASVKNRPACYLCWLYCPEGIVKAGIPIQIDLDYCKGCGICAEECPARAITMVMHEEAKK